MAEWLLSICLALIWVTRVLGDVDPIVIQGSKFFYKTNGTQFFIKGVAYASAMGNQPVAISDVDLLAVTTSCERDIPVLQELGINTISVYNFQTNANHDDCMKKLQDAGIYVIAYLRELNTEGIQVSAPTWTVEQYQSKTKIVDAMAKYNNLLGFIVEDSVSNTTSNSGASAFVKAGVRDIKAYIASKSYRTIPVGYTMNDDAEVRDDIVDYFNCGSYADSIDMLGVNLFSWCGNGDSMNMKTSGWDEWTNRIKNYSAPVFISQYGCAVDGVKRDFKETGVLYGKDMAPYWNGGIVYAYAGDDYGLVQIGDSGASKNAAYTSYSSHLAKATPTPTNAASYTPTNTAHRHCPTVGSNWHASKELPPSPDPGYCNCIAKHSQCMLESGLSDNATSGILTTICGTTDDQCASLSTDTSKGTYGDLSMCNPQQGIANLVSNYTETKASKCAVQGATVNPNYVGTGTCVHTPIFTGPLPTESGDGSSGDGSSDGTSNSDSTGSNLSPGEIAAVAVVVVVGVATIIGVAYFLLRRRRKAKQKAAEEAAKASSNGTAEEGPAELPMGGHHDRSELGGRVVPAEMSQGRYFETAELHGQAARFELDARSVHEMSAQQDR